MPDLADTEESEEAEETATSVQYRTCPLCEATCGLEVSMRGSGPDAQVVRIRGDRDDVFSHGFICPKGSTLKHLHEDPDRLRAPMVKRDGEWVEVGWDEAFAEIERRLPPLLDEHGRHALALYLGNPSVHNHGTLLYVRPLIMAAATPNLFSASTVDQMPKHVSSGLLFGNALTIPVPDLDRTDYLLMLGADPWESNGSLCTAPDFPGRLKGIQQRGGRFVVVDPRYSRTAQEADEHLFIRPGTDALWLAALVTSLFEQDVVDLGDVADIVDGVDEVRDALADFTPESVAEATGIDADATRRIARELATAPTAAVYGRIGTCTVSHGTLASWLIDVLNILTGNLDRPGGAMFPTPAHVAERTKPGGRGFAIGRHHSRAKGFPEVRSEYPVATLPDEILTPGGGQVRALITVAGNPARSAPDSQRMEEALEALEFYVAVDPYLNETTRFADVILPGPSPLAKTHYDLGFYGREGRNVANWSPALVEATGPQESEILGRLSMILSGQGDGDPTVVDGLVTAAILQRALSDERLAGRELADLEAALDGDLPADRAVDAMLRTGPYGDWFGAVPDGLSVAKLRDHPHGIDLGSLRPMLPNLLSTASGRVELAPQPILDDLPRLRAALDERRNGTIVLVGRRHLRSNNSWMHNVKVLVKGKDRCTLLVNPDDASRLGLVDGGTATVASRAGKVDAPVEVTDQIMPGVVSLPHGWGHDADGTRQRVAREHPGVNTNVLTDGELLDPLSGNAALNGVPVTVAPA